jgi:integrase
LEKLSQLKPFFNKTLSEIDNQDLLNYVAHFRNLGRKPSTINRNLNVLSSVINFCKNQNYKTPNIKIAQYKQREPDENVKTFENMGVIDKIIKRVEEEKKDYMKAIIQTALYTGMRKGNTVTLKWENLDFTTDTISVFVKDRTKDGGRLLTIPIIPKLKEILLKQPKINEYVFNYRGRPVKNIDKAWRSIFYKTDKKGSHTKELIDPELKYQVFNTLRHTSATWILRETGNLKIVQQVLGHKNIKTTLKYAHVLDSEKRQALVNVFK